MTDFNKLIEKLSPGGQVCWVLALLAIVLVLLTWPGAAAAFSTLLGAVTTFILVLRSGPGGAGGPTGGTTA